MPSPTPTFTYYLRATSQYVWFFTLTAFALLMGATWLFYDGLAALLPTLCLLVIVCALNWVFNFSPVLVVDQSGLGVYNYLRSYHLTWQNLEEIESRWGLTVRPRRSRPIPVSAFGGSGSGLRAGYDAARTRRSAPSSHTGEASYSPGLPIPRLGQGVYSLRATTFTVNRFLEELHLELGQEKTEPAGQAPYMAKFRPFNLFLLALAAGAGLGWRAVI